MLHFILVKSWTLELLNLCDSTLCKVIDDLTRLGNLFISSVMFIMFLFTGITIQEVFRQTKDLEEPCCDKVLKTLCPWFKEWCDTLDPSFSFSATTINRYSSIVTPASNNPNPTNSSDKYHKCRLNAVVTAFITSFF